MKLRVAQGITHGLQLAGDTLFGLSDLALSRRYLFEATGRGREQIGSAPRGDRRRPSVADVRVDRAARLAPVGDRRWRGLQGGQGLAVVGSHGPEEGGHLLAVVPPSPYEELLHRDVLSLERHECQPLELA